MNVAGRHDRRGWRGVQDFGISIGDHFTGSFAVYPEDKSFNSDGSILTGAQCAEISLLGEGAPGGVLFLPHGGPTGFSLTFIPGIAPVDYDVEIMHGQLRIAGTP